MSLALIRRIVSIEDTAEMGRKRQAPGRGERRLYGPCNLPSILWGNHIGAIAVPSLQWHKELDWKRGLSPGGWVLENRGQKKTTAAKEFFFRLLGVQWKFRGLPSGSASGQVAPAFWILAFSSVKRGLHLDLAICWEVKNMQAWIFWQCLACGRCSGNVVSLSSENQIHGAEFCSLLRGVLHIFACSPFPLGRNHTWKDKTMFI